MDKAYTDEVLELAENALRSLELPTGHDGGSQYCQVSEEG